MAVIRNIFDGSGSCLVAIRNTVVDLHYSGEDGFGVMTIRDTISGLRWGGETVTCMVVIRITVAGLVTL